MSTARRSRWRKRLRWLLRAIRTFTLITLTLLGLAFFVAWPASEHFTQWRMSLPSFGWNWSLYQGSFSVSYLRYAPPGPGRQVSRLDLPGLRVHQSRAPDAEALGRLESRGLDSELSLRASEIVSDVHCTYVSVGLWLPAVFLLAAPAWVLLKRGRHHWRCWRAGICLRCNHELDEASQQACWCCGCRVPRFPRAVVLSGLSLATLAMFLIGTASFWGKQRWSIPGRNDSHVGIQIDRGRVLICKWELLYDEDLVGMPPERYDRWSYVDTAPINKFAWLKFQSVSTEYGGALAARLAGRNKHVPDDAQAQDIGWVEYEVVTVGFTAIAFPLAAAVLLVGAYPLIALLQRLFGHRIPVGHCRNCGYDLTANVTGVCPECGAPAEEIVNA